MTARTPLPSPSPPGARLALPGRLALPLRELALDLAALVWPTTCVGCGAADRECCRSCRARLREAPEMLVRELDGLPCVVRGRYEGPLRAVLVAFKHGGRAGFRRMLGEALRAPLVRAIRIAALAASGGAPCAAGAAGAADAPGAPGAPGASGAPLIVAMPSRPRGVRERGYRHLDVVIASALRRQRAPALRVAALRTTRGRAGQVGLSAAQRERNARRIAVRRSARRIVRGRLVVLVDDIITTGASVRAARVALERAGASVVVIVALCTAERLDAAGLPAKSRMNI